MNVLNRRFGQRRLGLRPLIVTDPVIVADIGSNRVASDSIVAASPVHGVTTITLDCCGVSLGAASLPPPPSPPHAATARTAMTALMPILS